MQIENVLVLAAMTGYQKWMLGFAVLIVGSLAVVFFCGRSTRKTKKLVNTPYPQRELQSIPVSVPASQLPILGLVNLRWDCAVQEIMFPATEDNMDRAHLVTACALKMVKQLVKGSRQRVLAVREDGMLVEVAANLGLQTIFELEIPSDPLGIVMLARLYGLAHNDREVMDTCTALTNPSWESRIGDTVLIHRHQKGTSPEDGLGYDSNPYSLHHFYVRSVRSAYEEKLMAAA